MSAGGQVLHAYISLPMSYRSTVSIGCLHPMPDCARLLKRVFDIDLEHCPQCGGDLKIIAAIEEPAVIVRILTHLGLPARAPPRSPARPLDLFRAA